VPVRATETSLPAGLTAADLGESAGDTSAVLVSYHSSPCSVGRLQTYVVFVLDAAIQATVEKYRWVAGSVDTETTEGVFEHSPAVEGDLRVEVSLLDGGGATVKTLSITQNVVPLNGELEFLIARPDEPTAVADDPETSREIVNDVRVYIDELAPRSADPDSSLNRLLFAIAYAEALIVKPGDRAAQERDLAAALAAGEAGNFTDRALTGIGLCQVRPQILAMYLSATAGGSTPMLPPREFPVEPQARATKLAELRTEFIALAAAERIDLFNALRFPKSNLRMAMQLVQELMKKYFPALSLRDILADKTEATSLLKQFKEGPSATT
jgi:hypothetical protein